MPQSSPIASTALGDLEGLWDDGVAVFRNVPYAAPPVGSQRFAAPGPVTAWKTRRDARDHGPIAPQPPSRLRAAVGDYVRPQGEDCLSLTIWTPGTDRNAARPVLVWLHGGAYMSGGGSLDMYDGGALSREGELVVVGVNYRLGACGFLHHPNVNEPNPGLADQQAALRWVGAHIADFGGDPANITVMGQSAGGGSIAFHLADPKARGLFRRAILQSAALYAPMSAAEAAARAVRFGELLGIDAARPDFAERLRAVPIADLLAAQVKFVREVASLDPLSLPFSPVGHDAETNDAYIERVAEGAGGKELLIGWTREEMHAFYAADPALQHLDAKTLAARSQAMTGDPAEIDAYRIWRPGGTALDLLADFTTDHRFVRPAQRLAEIFAGRGGKVWTYRFDWQAPNSIFKACHCIELPFLFGSEVAQRATAPMLTGGDAAEMAALGAVLRRTWIEFARGGNPAHAGLPAWPAQQGARPATLAFDRSSRLLKPQELGAAR